MLRAGAIIVAAGDSRRMAGTNKVFVPVAGKPVLSWVLETFQSCPGIAEIVMVLAGESVSRGRQLVLDNRWTKVSNVCPGGPRRQDSVREGLRHLGDCPIVAVHDGARPCVTSDVIERGIAGAAVFGAAIAAVPATDTVKRVSREGEVIETIPRNGLWLVQTPQVFLTDLLRKSYENVSGDVTDDAALVERLGHKVKVYMGSYENIKITAPEDLVIAEAIIKSR
ncbi:MAG: 2-C-methyl-D-erythritol 4-phosphate cytidylyltransferase [Chloroflexi bacterium]|nr:2-C-methyl-D-erythritol 4-phosphate cytidylyltransferase [Chloroflexota bacterium]